MTAHSRFYYRLRTGYLLMTFVFLGLIANAQLSVCLLYTSDAADERSSVDLGGRRIIKKKKIETHCVPYIVAYMQRLLGLHYLQRRTHRPKIGPKLTELSGTEQTHTYNNER